MILAIPKLRTLSMSGGEVVGEAVQNQAATTLHELRFEQVQASPKLLRSLAEIEGLETVWLNEMNVTPAVVRALAGLQQLKWLMLMGQISWEILGTAEGAQRAHEQRLASLMVRHDANPDSPTSLGAPIERDTLSCRLLGVKAQCTRIVWDRRDKPDRLIGYFAAATVSGQHVSVACSIWESTLSHAEHPLGPVCSPVFEVTGRQ